MHVIKLDGYNATVDNGEKLELGTFDSFGEEQLQIVKAPDWVNLSVIATFNPPNRKPVQAVVDSVTGVIKVPKEATAGWYGVGTIVFVGIADGVQRISSDVEYIVRRHSNASGTEPAEPTPSVVEQILTEAQNANVNSAEAKKLATDAKDIVQSVRTDADNGKFNGKDGAKGDKGDDGTTPQLKIGEDNLWHVSYNNGATWVSLGVKATGAAGEDGAAGLTPYIGENGNWWLGDTDTGVSAKGDKGDTGAKGADGVSPTASVTQTDDGAEFTVTDASGTTTATIRNGTNGKDGAPGAAGKDAVVDATLTQDGQAADAKVTGEKISQLKEDLGEKLDNFYISNEYVKKRTSSGSIGSHYLIKYSVNFDDYQMMKFVTPSTGKTYKIEFANSQSEVLKTVDTSGFVYGSEVLLSIPLTTSEIIIEVAYEVGVGLEITLYKKTNINAEDVASAMRTSVYTNYNNLLRAENITDNVQIQH